MKEIIFKINSDYCKRSFALENAGSVKRMELLRPIRVIFAGVIKALVRG